MASHTSLVTMVLASLLIAGCQTSVQNPAQRQASSTASGVPATAELRTAAEMRQSVGPQGYTAWGHSTNGSKFVAYTAPNGTTVVKSGTFVDHGVWQIAPGGKWCLKWQKIRNGVETCLTQYVNGKDIYNVFPNGTLDSVVTRVVPGNPDHL